MKKILKIILLVICILFLTFSAMKMPDETWSEHLRWWINWLEKQSIWN